MMKPAEGLKGSWSQGVSKLVQNFAPLFYYAASSVYFLPTFRVNLSVPSSVVLPLEDGTDRLIEMSIRNHHYSLRNKSEETSYRLLSGGSLKSRKVLSK